MKRKSGRPVVCLIIIVVIVFSGCLVFGSETIGKKGKSFQVTGGETRPVLDPSAYVGMTKMAYAAAKQFPKQLDQIYCYCNCDQPPFNHKSLLSCFVTDHGEN